MEDAVKHGVSTTNTGNIRAEGIAAMACYLLIRDRLPINAAGLIVVDAAFIAAIIGREAISERRGPRGYLRPRLPPPLNDETDARTFDGLVADFTSADFLRSVAAINALTETQFRCCQQRQP